MPDFIKGVNLQGSENVDQNTSLQQKWGAKIKETNRLNSTTPVDETTQLQANSQEILPETIVPLPNCTQSLSALSEWTWYLPPWPPCQYMLCFEIQLLRLYEFRFIVFIAFQKLHEILHVYKFVCYNLGAIQTAADHQMATFTLWNEHQTLDKPVDIKWLIKGKEPTVHKVSHMVSSANDPISAYRKIPAWSPIFSPDLRSACTSKKQQHLAAHFHIWKVEKGKIGFSQCIIRSISILKCM